MKYAKGISWIGDCRIPFVDEGDNNTTRERYDTIGYGSKMNNGWGSMDDSAKQGRFTPNLLVCDDMLNDGSVSNGNKPSKRNKNHRYSMDYGLRVYEGMDITGYADKGSNSRYYNLDMWFDKMLDRL